MRPTHPHPLHIDHVGFPRPSGRGSIAAPRSCDASLWLPGLPPAIRPGLHCGNGGAVVEAEQRRVFPRPSGRGSIAAVPSGWRGWGGRPASPGHQAGAPLRLGRWLLRCLCWCSSPGHQAGAPLRRELDVRHTARRAASPGHQAGAPLRRSDRRADVGRAGGFPRPSGRGSIAAHARCSWRGSTMLASPGHQAGAPLRPPL